MKKSYDSLPDDTASEASAIKKARYEELTISLKELEPEITIDEYGEYQVEGRVLPFKSLHDARAALKRIKDKVSGTHRLNWEYANDQKIPKDMLILHTCDYPPCLLPSHLWLGTHEDNMRDMVDKGRTPRVEFCKRGHNMAEASYIRSNGYRQCRPCSVMDAQKTRDRKKLNK